MMDLIQNKLNEIKKKYPKQNFQILRFVNSDLNIVFATRNWIGTVLIESVPYEGVCAAFIEQNFSEDLSVVVLIIDVEKFQLSGSRALELISEYEI